MSRAHTSAACRARSPHPRGRLVSRTRQDLGAGCRYAPVSLPTHGMKLRPAVYWVLHGDAINRRIHMEVLLQIKVTSEKGVTLTARR